MNSESDPKQDIKEFWEESACGEQLYLTGRTRADFDSEEALRYEIEPFIADFARFADFSGKKVLEIGLGTGVDHKNFCAAGAVCWGIDLTKRSVDLTSDRISTYELESSIIMADMETLPFDKEKFDHVYSCGAIHHTANVNRAVDEIFRVLKVGGSTSVMIYHKWSCVGIYLWIRYALLSFKPRTSLDDIYCHYMESPRTKAFTTAEAKAMFKNFSKVEVTTRLSRHDLLSTDAGQRHRGFALTMARKLLPRKAIKMFLKRNGLYMLIRCIK